MRSPPCKQIAHISKLPSASIIPHASRGPAAISIALLSILLPSGTMFGWDEGSGGDVGESGEEWELMRSGCVRNSRSFDDFLGFLDFFCQLRIAIEQRQCQVGMKHNE